MKTDAGYESAYQSIYRQTHSTHIKLKKKLAREPDGRQGARGQPHKTTPPSRDRLSHLTKGVYLSYHSISQDATLLNQEFRAGSLAGVMADTGYHRTEKAWEKTGDGVFGFHHHILSRHWDGRFLNIPIIG